MTNGDITTLAEAAALDAREGTGGVYSITKYQYKSALALAAPQPPPWGWGRGCHSNLPVLPRGQPFPTPPNRAPPRAAAPPRPATRDTRHIPYLCRTPATTCTPASTLGVMARLSPVPTGSCATSTCCLPSPGIRESDAPTSSSSAAAYTTPITSLRRASDRRLRWRHCAPAR
eukprot:scaffold1567_cov106-Isochrysis_galbana.AAC.15